MGEEKTISRKIIHIIVWINALAFTLISIGTAFLVYQLSLHERMTSLRVATTTLADDVNGWFEREMANCAQTAQIVNNLYELHDGSLSFAERRSIYKAVMVKNRQYLNSYDAVGLEFVSGIGGTLPDNYDPTKRGWYLEAIKTPGQTAVVPPYVDAITGAICMTFAQTVAPDDGGRGVFGLDITLDEIRDYVGNANKNPQSHFFIVDAQGRIIVHPKPDLMPDKNGAFTTMTPQLWRKIAGGDDTVLDYDAYGEPAYYISSPLRSTGWRIVSNVRLREVVMPIIAVVAMILASFTVIIASIVTVLKYRLNTLITAPLDSLRQIANEMAEGDNHVPINPERYQSEFRLFAESFKQVCELRHTSSLDSLSRLLNRRAFFSAAERGFALMRRQGSSSCALMMDIDFFKLVNDTHGHSAGDRVIMRVADILRERLRATDLSGRYGGEEFCVWLPNTDRSGALLLAEELRNSVSFLQFEGEAGLLFGVTISIGLADVEAASIGALLEYADEALYRAKRCGRNRVEVYGEAAPIFP
ncbi:MAG: diguanylate cyclase [Desulfobulbus sp.]|nr:diguanylate cyclase [Desulfobulbus sp.]